MCTTMCTVSTAAENRLEFFEKLQRVCGQITAGTPVHPILSSVGSTRLTVGNWSLISQKEGEVTIHNADGTKVSYRESEREKVNFE